MDYTTQMDAARKGIITREMELVARKEKRTAEEIRQWVAEGRAAIPCNRVHKALDPNGIGSMLKTKINVNLGTSRDCMDLDTEVDAQLWETYGDYNAREEMQKEFCDRLAAKVGI